MIDHDLIEELLPIYALGAATDDEVDAIRSHLERCDRCSEELGLHLTTVSALDRDERPSTETWSRIVSDIARADELATVTPIGEKRDRRLFRALAGVAASLALVFVGFSIARLTGGSPLDTESVVAASEDAALMDGSIVTDFIVDDHSIAHIVLTEEGRGFIIPTDYLPELDASRAYQLWVINTDEAVISAGVLGNDPAPAPFTWTGEVAGLALTREVAGGVVSSAGDVVSVVTDL